MAIDLEKLEDSPHLLDLLIQMEDVLDSLDIYVFKNWIDGELVEGPIVRRYWLDMTLKFAGDKMPDPRAGLRLLKHGVRVDFEKGAEEATRAEPAEDGSNANKIWLVRISVPRRLIADTNAGELDFYDEEIDAEDVSDAQDGGMNDESGLVDQDGAAPDPNAPVDPNAPPAEPGAAPDPNAPPIGGPAR